MSTLINITVEKIQQQFDVIKNIQIAEKGDLLKEHTKMAKEVNNLENQTKTVARNISNEKTMTALTNNFTRVSTTNFF